MSRDIRVHKGRSIILPQDFIDADRYTGKQYLSMISYAPVKAPVRRFIGRCDCARCAEDRRYSSIKAQLSADMSLREWQNSCPDDDL